MLNMSSTDAITLATRTVVFNGSTVKVNDGYSKVVSSPTNAIVSNTMCIPRKIYGYK